MYLQGLMQALRKNMERMEEVVPDCNYQSLHHFVSESDWEFRAVLDQVAADADRLLGGSTDSCLLIDESSFQKKGKSSVGVERQWNGRLGKVENSQVAVFVSLAQGRYSTLIDTRLYLPKRWVEDPRRCLAAGVPKPEVVLKSKADLAIEMVVQARLNGVRFAWVGADGGYGKEPAFLRRLAELGEVFVADVHKSQQIYLQDPDPRVPEKKGLRGKPPSLLQAQSESQRVDAWAASQPPELWQKVAVRPGTKGEVRVEALRERVWLWDGSEEKAHRWHVLAIREGALRRRSSTS